MGQLAREEKLEQANVLFIQSREHKLVSAPCSLAASDLTITQQCDKQRKHTVKQL